MERAGFKPALVDHAVGAWVCHLNSCTGSKLVSLDSRIKYVPVRKLKSLPE